MNLIHNMENTGIISCTALMSEEFINMMSDYS